MKKISKFTTDEAVQAFLKHHEKLLDDLGVPREARSAISRQPGDSSCGVSVALNFPDRDLARAAFQRLDELSDTCSISITILAGNEVVPWEAFLPERHLGSWKRPDGLTF